MFFLKGRALLAQPFDPVRLTLSGEPIRIADAVDQDAPGRSSFDVSHNGVLAYIAPPARDIVQFIWVDAVGRTTGRLGNAGPYRSFALSPDGRSVLADREEPEKAGVFARSVERFAVASGTATPVRRAGTFPTWSPDGKTFAHRGGTGRPMIRLTASDGSDPDGKSLGQAMNAYPVDWSRDGRFLIGVAIRYETTSRDLFAVELDKGHLTFPVESPFEECDPRLSPDGQWLAYAAMNESNRWEVLVRPFGKPGGVWRVSPRGGRFPRWIDNGRALLFVEPDGSLVRASLSFDSGEVRATSTARLFQHDALIYEYSVPAPLYPYDVTDGRILMRIVEQPSQPQPINVILNWQSLVRR
jgi:hypothetical protein